MERWETIRPVIPWAGLLDSWKTELQSKPALRTPACHESHDFTTYLTLTISHALSKIPTPEKLWSFRAHFQVRYQ